jgi:hypothetical protein
MSGTHAAPRKVMSYAIHVETALVGREIVLMTRLFASAMYQLTASPAS